jgi:triosephosphate isomerase
MILKMRKPIVGANWKMYRGIPSEAEEMLKELIPKVGGIKNVDIVIVPPYTSIIKTIDLIKHTSIKVGAQNMYYEEVGAFTGEISPLFLKKLGCDYVILGHSERRNIFNETDELINKKVKKALEMDLIPIVCIGEHLNERENGNTKGVIEKQFKMTFDGLNQEQMINLIIAYEPIWAIGTGKTATPEQAEEIHIFIRKLIEDKYNKDTAERVRIQYGGSIKPSNARELFSKDNIDGGLVGGASLQAESLYQIINSIED